MGRPTEGAKQADHRSLIDDVSLVENLLRLIEADSMLFVNERAFRRIEVEV